MTLTRASASLSRQTAGAIERRLHLQQVDAATAELEEALAWVDEALEPADPKSIALIGNAAEVLPVCSTAWYRMWSPIRRRPMTSCTAISPLG